MKYQICYEGGHRETIEADSDSAALSAGEDSAAIGYDATDRTLWVDAYVHEICPVCSGSGEHEDGCSSDAPLLAQRVTATVHPREPRCTANAHDWQSPHEIVGGDKSNPGVWGHGGGVIIKEICAHCGCERTRDTWAQRSDTGEQGLESVKYAVTDHVS